ncbi:MAG: hypothetical protein C4K58_00915 [Flavobacteriaceae bacterium]|nr:MAG: hypothetical protein C4K58_00915 [Flavobacteriaceae bacterium]
MKKCFKFFGIVLFTFSTLVQAQKQDDLIVELGGLYAIPSAIGEPILMTSPMGQSFPDSGGKIDPFFGPIGLIKYMSSDHVGIATLIGLPPQMKYHGHISYDGTLYEIEHTSNMLPLAFLVSYLTGQDRDIVRIGITGGIALPLSLNNEVVITDTSKRDDPRAPEYSEFSSLYVTDAYQRRRRMTPYLGLSAYVDITPKLGVYASAVYMPLGIEYTYKGKASDEFVNGIIALAGNQFVPKDNNLIINNEVQVDPIFLSAGITYNFGSLGIQR